MATGIYLAGVTQQSGKSLAALGLVETLIKHTEKIGYFRPVFYGETEANDSMISLLRERYSLKNVRGGVSLARCRELLAEGNHEEISNEAVSAYTELATECDVIIVDGTSLVAHNAATVEFELNAQIARDLGLPVIAVASAKNSSAADAANAVEVAHAQFTEEHVDLAAVILNRVAPENRDAVVAAVKDEETPVFVINEVPVVSQPTVDQIVKALDLNAGNYTAEQLNKEINEVRVAAMGVPNFLKWFKEDDFVIAPGDRDDIINAVLDTRNPKASGLLLTGGLSNENVATRADVPVFSTELDTFAAGRDVSNIQGKLSAGQPRKVAAALGEWANSVDEDAILELIEVEHSATMTPLRFLHGLISKARANRRTIVLPEGYDHRILRASEIIARRDFCNLVLIGNPERIHAEAKLAGVTLPEKGIRIIDLDNNEYTEDFAATYAELRAKKGVTIEQAREKMQDPSYFGTMLVKKGIVDGMVSGAVNTTANTIRPSLEFVKTRPGVSIVSSVFLMLTQDRGVLVFGDCAVNPNPNGEQLADIAKASAETARQFGVDPKVALLSYSTGTSGKGPDVDIVKEGVAALEAAKPDFPFEGPIQFDAASNMSIASAKLPGSEVAGQATVFVFPDLNTGNNTYKAVQQTSGAVAVGPVLQGLNKPVNDLSRGCTVDDIINTVAITAIQAQTL